MTDPPTFALHRLILQTQQESDSSDNGYESDDGGGKLPAKLPAKPKHVMSSYRKMGWVKRSTGIPKEKVDDELWRLAELEWGGNKANGVFFIGGKESETKADFKKWYKCAFCYQSNCRKYYRVVTSKSTNLRTIQVAGGTDHSDHSVKLTRGAHKNALVAGITSPGDLKKGPKKVLGRANRKLKNSGELALKFTREEQTSI